MEVLRAAVGNDAGYDAYLAVIPASALADMYLRHGSQLLEGNVRTYLGRVGNVNRGIANTLAKEPEKFFAYNNGIAATACAVSIRTGQDGGLLLTEATDLQIVNGAQTTASLAAARREKKLPVEAVFVPMKLSVVPPEISRRLLAPSIGGSQVQTHWFYERARGQHLKGFVTGEIALKKPRQPIPHPS